MIRGKKSYTVKGKLKTCSEYDVLGYVIAKNKHNALLKALLKNEEIRSRLHCYQWDTIFVHITK